jgi:hypothetical protein
LGDYVDQGWNRVGVCLDIQFLEADDADAQDQQEQDDHQHPLP